MNEMEILARVIDLPAEYQVSLPGGLSICRLSENHFQVEYEMTVGDETELRDKSFKSAEAAVKFFVDKRHARKLGSDYFTADLDNDSET
ncbi:MAG: hypothetical protein NTV55_06605 [Planctomycetota bacterium]|nr:hypothetical protein [Planctomycetota bacterium]RLS41279.1 MAG: hypothetical protein DWH82_00645 [Planctomycetota bacterium]